MKCCKKTLNPYWNKTYTLPVPKKDLLLKLEVWDKNKLMSDQLIGTFDIKWNNLTNFKEEIKTEKLDGKNLKK